MLREVQVVSIGQTNATGPWRVCARRKQPATWPRRANLHARRDDGSRLFIFYMDPIEGDDGQIASELENAWREQEKLLAQ
jgi:hypothetical protein